MLNPDPLDFAALQPDEAAARINGHTALRATPYRWPDPASLPRRQWLIGHWLLRGEVTAIIAPGGTGKSTIGNALALSLASKNGVIEEAENAMLGSFGRPDIA